MSKVDTKRQINWGIIGTNSVAHDFSRALTSLKQATITHVVSGSHENAKTFASHFPHSQTTDDFYDFINTPTIDAVYIASPTRLHTQHVTAALKAGKHVLCEKPLTCDSQEAKTLFELASSNKLLCFEGMWMRFNPLVQKTVDLIKNKEIGDLISIHAELGYQKQDGREKDSTRGALWDFAVYPLSLFHLINGVPKNLSAYSGESKPNTKPPRSFSAHFQWPSSVATLICSIQTELNNSITFHGTKGSLTLGPSLICPEYLKSTLPLFPGSRLNTKINRLSSLLINRNISQDPYMISASRLSGFYHQALEANELILSGCITSPTVPPDSTCSVIAMAEKIQLDITQ